MGVTVDMPQSYLSLIRHFAPVVISPDLSSRLQLICHGAGVVFAPYKPFVLALLLWQYIHMLCIDIVLVMIHLASDFPKSLNIPKMLLFEAILNIEFKNHYIYPMKCVGF